MRLILGRELQKVREKIACWQFGDDHFGEWGILTINQRRTILRMIETIQYLDGLLESAIIPPCKVGTHLWRITKPYRKAPKVTEFIVKNFRTVGKKHKIQIEVQALNVPVTNWMYYEDFYTSKEEAERALKGGADNERNLLKKQMRVL